MPTELLLAAAIALLSVNNILQIAEIHKLKKRQNLIIHVVQTLLHSTEALDTKLTESVDIGTLVTNVLDRLSEILSKSDK